MAEDTKLFGMKAESGRWIFILLGFVINICLGSVYAFSVFKIPLQNWFLTTHKVTVGSFEGILPFMIFLMFFAILMFFGGRVLDRLGPKKIGIIGGILVGLGWILAGILPNIWPSIWAVVITYGMIGGGGVGLAYGGPIAVAARWFPDKKGLAVGLTLAGFGGSPFISANVASALIKAVNPLNTFIFMGIAFVIIVILLSLFLKFPVTGWKPAGWTPKATGVTAAAELSTSEMVKTPTFWGLFLAFTIGSLAGLMAIGISSPVGTEVIKLDAAAAAVLVGVFAIFNGLGRPLFGWLTDRITPRWAALINLAIICVAAVFMLQAGAGTMPLYVACFCALWLCLGGWLAIAPTATTIFFGARHYARNYGVVFFSYGIGAILGSIISGLAKDIFGDYSKAFMITASLAAVAIILVIFLMKPFKKA
ncbi:MAG: OFA family MFS transporter [Chloroflexi bacterium]|nr:OFA family MFS transporter [Chloroflexota bacterium]